MHNENSLYGMKMDIYYLNKFWITWLDLEAGGFGRSRAARSSYTKNVKKINWLLGSISLKIESGKRTIAYGSIQ